MFYLDFMLIIYQIFKTNASIEVRMKANKVGFSTLYIKSQPLVKKHDLGLPALDQIPR
jgi:hypothetical protein